MPEEIKEVALGTEFNMFLTISGQIWISGAIS